MSAYLNSIRDAIAQQEAPNGRAPGSPRTPEEQRKLVFLRGEEARELKRIEAAEKKAAEDAAKKAAEDAAYREQKAAEAAAKAAEEKAALDAIKAAADKTAANAEKAAEELAKKTTGTTTDVTTPETTSPDVLSDFSKNKLLIAGGGALLLGWMVFKALK